MERAEREAELRRWNIPEAQIQQALGDISSDEFQIYPENWQTFDVFWRVKHQWHIVAGFSGIYYQGLNYSAIESVLRLLKIQETEEIFNGLQIMEAAAKKVLNS
ncbi:MAG TPA: hypothetical protein DCG63_03725 [Methylophilaceae bacterium]|nr:hypothetical protein [Methylophilaceae bacterium]